MGTLAATSAVALGAKVVEKHFTLDHDLPGPDHWFSLDPSQMKEMVEGIRYVEEAMGSGEVVPHLVSIRKETSGADVLSQNVG